MTTDKTTDILRDLLTEVRELRKDLAQRDQRFEPGATYPRAGAGPLDYQPRWHQHATTTPTDPPRDLEESNG